ncbi:hypothetical protein KC367_g84 [Hortaea werneckii]|nr:hypothetical protein KC367_g84 [Hortaea werneckii]
MVSNSSLSQNRERKVVKAVLDRRLSSCLSSSFKSFSRSKFQCGERLCLPGKGLLVLGSHKSAALPASHLFILSIILY